YIYVPVEGGVAQPDARRLLQKMQLQIPSIDYLPHASAASGCIRPPGSAHIDGGHQKLINNLHTAKLILENPAPRSNFETFMNHVDATVPDHLVEEPEQADQHSKPIFERKHEASMSVRAMRIVREADTTGYHSPSEARFAA